MWKIKEHKEIAKGIRKIPIQVRKKYEIWKNLIFRHGPSILKDFPGFHDEKLKGKRSHQRSSKLNIQHGVIYEVSALEITVYIIEISPHDY